MNFNAKRMGLMLAAGVLFAGMSSFGAVLIEWQGDNNGDANNFTGWASDGAFSDGVSPRLDMSSQNGSSGPLNMAIDQSGDHSMYNDVHFTTAGELTGDLTRYANGSDMPYLQMNFYSDPAGEPEGLGFYFQGNGHEWYYDIDSSYVNDGWNTFRIQLSDTADPYGGYGWYEEDYTPGATIATDMQSVDRVGWWIAYNTAANQTQQVGMYGISVPEPETYLLLGMALLSVAIVFRKRISESLAEARAVMRS